jgi:hypothetical protein
MICISLVAKDGEYFFIYFLAICTSPEKHLFGSFAHLYVWEILLVIFR